MKRRRLIELVVVYPLLAVGLFLLVLVFAVPRFGVHPRRTERAAIASLRTLKVAQDIFRKAGHVDLDGDGVGEYGTFGELTASVALRGEGTRSRIEPALLAPSYRPGAGSGRVQRAGYRYRIYLPGTHGRVACADQSPHLIDPDGAETTFVAFAWAAPPQEGAWWTFRIDQTGTVTATSARLDPATLAECDCASWAIVP